MKSTTAPKNPERNPASSSREFEEALASRAIPASMPAWNSALLSFRRAEMRFAPALPAGLCSLAVRAITSEPILNRVTELVPHRPGDRCQAGAASEQHHYI